MEWKEVSLPAFETTLSTGQNQPLPREYWAKWAQMKYDYPDAWSTWVGGPLAMSTGTLSTGNVQVSIDMERMSEWPPFRRYYRYHYVKIIDGRVFQSSPIKDVEYGHHHERRPTCLPSYITGLGEV